MLLVYLQSFLFLTTSPFLFQLKRDESLEADKLTVSIHRPSRKSVTKMLCKRLAFFQCLFIRAKDLCLALMWRCWPRCSSWFLWLACFVSSLALSIPNLVLGYSCRDAFQVLWSKSRWHTEPEHGSLCKMSGGELWTWLCSRILQTRGTGHGGSCMHSLMLTHTMFYNSLQGIVTSQRPCRLCESF